MNKERACIGEGKTAKIYLENGQAYKAFAVTYPLQAINYEAQIQNEICRKTKLPVPQLTLTENDHELAMPYIQGGTLGDRMRKEKYKLGVEDLVSLQLSTYKYSGLQLPQAHQVFKQQIIEAELDQELKEKALALLNDLEEKETLCHFDLHLLNIMYDGSDYFIIDWANAKLGNPVMDIARTYVILKQYAQRLANKYLKQITKDGAFSMTEVQAAIPLMAILRLLDGDVGEFKEKLYQLM